MSGDDVREDSPGVLRFQGVEIDETAFELRCFGRPVAVEPKVYALIACLTRHRERVVTKAELLQWVWQGAVVSDSAITRCVSLARRALGMSARIANVHGHGYRLLRHSSASAATDELLCSACGRAMHDVSFRKKS